MYMQLYDEFNTSTSLVSLLSGYLFSCETNRMHLKFAATYGECIHFIGLLIIYCALLNQRDFYTHLNVKLEFINVYSFYNYHKATPKHVYPIKNSVVPDLGRRAKCGTCHWKSKPTFYQLDTKASRSPFLTGPKNGKIQNVQWFDKFHSPESDRNDGWLHQDDFEEFSRSLLMSDVNHMSRQFSDDVHDITADRITMKCLKCSHSYVRERVEEIVIDKWKRVIVVIGKLNFHMKILPNRKR